MRCLTKTCERQQWRAIISQKAASICTTASSNSPARNAWVKWWEFPSQNTHAWANSLIGRTLKDKVPAIDLHESDGRKLNENKSNLRQILFDVFHIWSPKNWWQGFQLLKWYPVMNFKRGTMSYFQNVIRCLEEEKLAEAFGFNLLGIKAKP